MSSASITHTNIYCDEEMDMKPLCILILAYDPPSHMWLLHYGWC